MQLNINQYKAAFFDRKAVMSEVDKQKRKVFSKFGAFVMRKARWSMKNASKMANRKRNPQKYSQPGDPPFSRKGLLKQFLFFAWDSATRSVVVGPARLGGMSGDVPKTLEDGGTIPVRQGKQVVPVKYEARPYMGPAVLKTLPQMPAQWRNSVVRG